MSFSSKESLALNMSKQRFLSESPLSGKFLLLMVIEDYE